MPGGFKVIDAKGQSLAYFYARENDHDANTAGVLTMDEVRRTGEQLRSAAGAANALAGLNTGVYASQPLAAFILSASEGCDGEGLSQRHYFVHDAGLELHELFNHCQCPLQIRLLASRSCCSCWTALSKWP